MATLNDMPPISLPNADLQQWGSKWREKEAFGKADGMRFGKFVDARVAESLAVMLGGIPVRKPRGNVLIPNEDCVECGTCRVIGGIRPQNYDVCYRPDGVRFAFDSKSLNDAKSVQKNYQNMINDLATEATTVHMRFPYAVVGFMVLVPLPILAPRQRDALTGTLARLSGRESHLHSAHKAEVISLVVWDPCTGHVSTDWPPEGSLRIERFSEQVHQVYASRYYDYGLPARE